MRQEEDNRSDEALVNAVRAQSDTALAILYKRHFPMVLHFVLTNGGTEDEAKDIYQESIMVLYTNLQKPEFVLNCKLKTYLYSVSRHLWLKELEKKKTHNTKSMSIFAEDVDDFDGFLMLDESHLDENEHRELQYQQMEESLGKLGEPCKTIILDFYVHQLNMNEIAEKMGYTNASNAKNQKYKCLQRLLKLMGKD